MVGSWDAYGCTNTIQKGGGISFFNFLQCNPELLLLIRNSIEPSKTCNFTSFDDSLCDSNGIFGISCKRKEL